MNLAPYPDLITLLFFAFLVNLPLGYLREAAPRYSVRWFFYIHLSIPFIVAWRIFQDLGWEAVPFTVACAIAGQMLGGRMNRKRLNRKP